MKGLLQFILLTTTVFWINSYSSLLAQSYTMSTSTQSTCSGTFYDPGGTGNYGNNNLYTMTFCSSTPGDQIQIDFSSFSLESNWDYLYIYDGNSTGSPQIGTYTGTNSPGVVTSTNGCLTFMFDSDGSVTYPGWVATISCVGGGGGGGGNITMGNGSVTACSGNFYDSGGSSGTYSTNELYTLTICPDTPGAYVSLDFSAFNVEGGFDVLCIYDGMNTSAPTLGCYDNNVPLSGTVSATNPDGCLTIFFDSDGSVQYSGWAAAISCSNPCQDVIANANFSPAPDGDGVIRICQGDAVSMNGFGTYPDNSTSYTQSDGTSSFVWTTQNGPDLTGQNVSSTFNSAGAYIVELEITDIQGCDNDNDIDQYIFVSTTPVFAGTVGNPDPICAGEQSTMTGVVNPVTYEVTCTPPVFPPLALPDGSGVSYQTSVNLDCYLPGQTLTDINDLLDICVTMEHSYMGDLDIVIECPDGTQVTMVDYGVNGGGSTYLGEPIDNDGQPNAQGVGYTYCWSPGATNGTWGQNSGSVSTLPAGTYQSQESLGGLLGCPMNGDWTIIITDNLGSDNGFIFDWGINFDPSLLSASTTFTPTIVSTQWLSDPTIVSGTNPITVEPITAGNACYTFEATDDFGCTYDTTVCIVVNTSPIIDPIPDAVACDSYTLPTITGIDLTGNEAFYTGPGGTGTQYNAGDAITSSMTLYIYDEMTVAPFCSDEEMFNITINPTPDVDAGPDVALCFGAPSVTIGADPVTSVEGATYSWSPSGGSGTIDLSGGGQDHGQATVSPAVTTTYTLTVNNNGCIATDQVTVTVDVPPTASNPATIVVQCAADVPAPNTAVVTDEADDYTIPPTVTYIGDVSDGQSCPETITRTYRVTDGCGNYIDVTQTITIDDTTPPVFAAAPAAVTVQCVGDVPPMTNLGWTDNCDGAGSVAGTDGALSGPCGGTITRTWTYTDACGNTATATQIITVDDTTPPVFAAAPADVTVECIGDVPPMTNLGWTDNCDGAGSVAGTDGALAGGSCGGTITRTWTYTDACGNTATATQTITVDDTTPPVFAAAPADVTVECIGDVPPMTNLGWTDNCDGAGSVAGTDGALTGGSCGGTITRTWTYTDACGNVATATQTITVDDTTPPVFAAAPADVTVECIGDVPAMTNLAWTDNCDGTGTVAGTDGALTGGSCGGTITRTWTYTDACGNVATATQTITVDDTTPPVFAAAPADVTVECIGDVPAMTNLAWTDNCDGTGTVAGTDGALTGGSCGGTITRTWTYTDACGNVATATQTITVDDTTPPVFAAAPADVTVECVGDVPPMTNLAWTDNCDGTGTVTGTDGALTGGSCGGTITRTWSYTDACGNTVTATQTITVDDTTPPVFAAAPADVTVECIGDVPAMTDLGWTDNCDGAGTVTGTDGALTGGSCGGTITRTWTYTDACGNVATATQIITVDDTTPPVFAAAPADVTVECTGDIPAMTDLGWTDNCDGAGTVTGTDGALSGNCPATMVRTWTYTDACGNMATVTQNITVDDQTAPVFAAAPADVTVECIGDVPAMTDLGWTDNCDGAGTVTGTDGALTGGSCGGTITRTWTYTDACGNVATATQTITVDDTTPPVMDAPPADVTVECSGDVPAMVDLAWTDNCDGTGTVTGTDVSDGLSCPETITRTWTYTDACGNTATVTQTIIVDDTTPPTASNPADLNVPGGSAPAPDPNVVTDEADNCTLTPTVTWVSDATDGGVCPETITRIYSVTDDCGNETLVTQIITIGDAILPTASDPAPISVECIGDVPAPDPNVVTDEADNGATPIVTWEDDTSDGLSCPETITRRYRVTDDCGNFIFVYQTITVQDVTPPVMDPAPADITYECSADVPAIADLGWTDNCDGTGTVAGTEVSDGLSCPETITRTWTYTDACGNTATVSQTITVHDQTAPVFDPTPADVTVECSTDVPAMVDLAWTDNCDGTGTVTGTDVSDGLSCPETITRTWTYTDACGNIATVSQTITVHDVTAPVFDPTPADVTVECSGDVPAMVDLAWTDNCDGTGTVTGTDASDGLSCPETITRTWTYTDACGNVATVTQTIIVDDTTPPTASNPADLNVAGGSAPAPDPNVVTDEADNCTLTPTVTWVSDATDGGVCPETITRTYSIVDDCGNETLVTQIITIGDAIPPTASDPAPISVECIGDVPAPDPNVVTDEADNGATPTVTWEDDTSDGLSCPETITRRYRVTDDCGNFIFVYQTITVQDVTPPVMDPAPADITYECSADVPAIADLGWTDNCDGTGTVAGTEVSDGLSCPETITRTWTYTDACGNTATVSQTITVHDQTAPVFDPTPADVTVECITDVPAMVDLAWTDNCDGTGTVTGTDVSDGLTCPETITRTWTYTDACGNVATVSQTITVHDQTAPVFDPTPADVTVECSTDVPAMVDLNWTDNCDGTGTVTGTDVSDGLSCPETITRTWTYTDACGNVATVSQTITVHDVTAPVFDPTPADVTVECSGDVPAMVDLAWTDNCDGAGTVTGTDVSDGLSCPETITRTWTYTDACGNIATVSQTIIIDDTTPPTASDPATTVVPGGPAPAVDPSVVIDEADNCTPTPTVTFVSESTDGQLCPETITRIYSVTDDCGNETLVTHIIQITDPFPPTASDPAPISVECIGDVPAPDPNVVTDEADNGATPIVTWEDDTSDGLSCPETITRRYRVTDDCGNFILVNQTITVHDVTAPVLDPAPADLTVECITDVPAMVDLNWTDNCDGTGTVTGTDVSDGQSCPETITRTWTYTDACGNVATVSQIITVHDQTAPVFDPTPADVAVECSTDVPAMVDLAWTDNCDGTGTVTGTDVSDGLSCPETITRTWTYTDACGNVATVSQTITVHDVTAPVFDPTPADVTVECSTDVPAMVDLAWTDNCDGAGTVTGTDVSDGLSCPETITRTWTYTDACGNVATVSQTIIVDDTTPPTASDPATTVVPGGPAPAVDPSVVIDEADNCTPTPTVTFVSESSDGQPCPETITRIYSVTDDCGNETLVTHIIQITDPFPPTASDPAPISVECIGDVPAPDPLVVTDEADNNSTPIVTWEDDTSDGLSCPETITRRYRVTDDCGNFILVNQTITVHDVTAPVLDPAPADVTVECITDVPAMVDLNWTDNCDGTGTVTGTDVSDGQSCPETITRTWTYTDACGNVSTVSQVITVHDQTAPVFDPTPADVAVECSTDVPVMVDLAWTDNCDGTGTVTGTDVSDGLSCPETITRTWTITDACGNTSTVSQVITVHDITAPVFDPTPADVTVECSTDVPAMVDLAWTDNCDGAGTVTGTDVSDGLSCPETITRTWTYTDACGNVATVSQTIIVDDTTPPTASDPATTVVPGGPAPAVDPSVVIDEADNCTPTPTVTFVSESSDGQPCPETITRIYSVTDDCGNETLVTHIIQITDPFPPTASDPAAISVECIGDVPAPDPLVVTDEADNNGVPTVTWEDDTSDGLSCPETITRRYRVEDACGNFILVNQTITVHDVTAPILDPAPADVTVECITDVPAMVDLNWTDNCDGTGAVTGTDVSDGQSCPETITRTWTYTDACGNVATVSQVITVHDQTAPVFDPTPADVAVECSTDVPAMVDLAWTDNCDGTGTVTGTDVSDGLSCPETITRTWTITDACGNTSTVSQVITVHDITAPVFDPTPADVTVECSTDVPAMVDLAWTDNCDGAGTVTGTDVSDGLSCPETITRTWTYTDACGNVATVSQTIIVDDTTPPTASDPATTVVPGGPAPAVDPSVVIDEADNCTPTPTVTFVSESSDGQPCPETITRIYSVTDDCGNETLVTHLIQITDPIDPTGSDPAAITVECIGDVPAPDPLVVLDEADNNGVPTVTWEDDTSDGLSCPETITRRYRIEDVCGNFIFVNQTIVVHDVTAPVLDPAPADVTVECITDVPAMVDLAWTDNCDGAGTVTGTDVSDGQSCPETITRTWTYTDACGNNATVSQIIIVHDQTAPVFDPTPADVTVECSTDVPAMTDLAWTDNCDGAGTVSGTDVSDGQSCPETITRTWTYTDACGNVSSVSQVITVHDITAPVFAAPPAAVAVECSADVPAMIDLGWTDNCDVAGVVTGSDVSDGLSCPETITRTWTYTDACGNTSSVSQTITVHDLTAPVLAAPPANITVECSSDVPAMTDLGWTDNCDGAGTVTGTDVSDGLSCPETITRTWTYTDACGNTSSKSQTIIVDDTTPPTASNPTPIAVPGAMDVPAPDPNAVTDEADNCDPTPTVTWVSDVSDGNVCNGEIITRTYSVEDDCGNIIYVTQEILILATYPEVDAGPDQTICDGEFVLLQADNPDDAVISWEYPVVDGIAFQPSTTDTYTVYADNLGCITTDSATVTVESLPDVSFIADVTSGCTPLTVTFTNTTPGNLADCQWSFGNGEFADDCGSQTVVYESAGYFDVSLTTTSVNGCTSAVTYQDYIYTEDAPIADFEPSTYTVTDLDPTIVFTNETVGATDYVWNFGDGSATSSEENPSHDFTDGTGGSTVVLYAYSSLGCADTAYVNILVNEELIYYVPNAFTPDGDMHNQTFQPVFTQGFDIFDFNMTIFNRWGEIIFETNNAEIGWDGTYGGVLVQDGVYTWRIEFKTLANDERITIHGHVNVLK